jgi:serine/threonine-protein kinase RIO1
MAMARIRPFDRLAQAAVSVPEPMSTPRDVNVNSY